MGTGSSRKSLRESQHQVRVLQGRLQEIQHKNKEIERLHKELSLLKTRMSERDEKEHEITELREQSQKLEEQLKEARLEASKYKSLSMLVMPNPQLVSSPSPEDNPPSSSGSFQKFTWDEMRAEDASNRVIRRPQDRQFGIAAESTSMNQNDVLNKKLEHFHKDVQVKDLIRESIHDNDFLQHLQADQIEEIIECMQSLSVEPGVTIIKQGDDGDKLYVIESGQVKVTQLNDGVDVLRRKMRGGTLFGELAILYSTPRGATVTADTRCKLWSLERGIFQIIMMRTVLLKTKERLAMIKRIKSFSELPEELLLQITDAFEENTYGKGDYIVRQGAKGETFYIVTSGLILARKISKTGKQERRDLTKGDSFGEKTLDGEETTHQESMMATSEEGATCLSIDRDHLKVIMDKHAKISGTNRHEPLIAPREILPELKHVRLKELCIIGTLGVGGFGRVELAQIGEDSTNTYALKQIKKVHVVEMKQQNHILNERRILLKCHSDFIVKLHRTFRNNKYVYMLMDVSLGGELWRLLRDRGPFIDAITRFYTACTMEALDYLHARGIVYRDLKPENLLVSGDGYIKLVDFGFAKEIGHGKKTWTFCGTPEYVAPEIILNKGHDLSVDIWSLGILMFELLTGSPPFSAVDALKTYNMILKGMDGVSFPRRVSKNAKDLIKKLCRETPNERLGYSRAGIVEIQKHKWYDGFNWEGLRNHTLEGPLKPTVLNSTDMTNFDPYADEEDQVPEETSNWDSEFAEHFK